MHYNFWITFVCVDSVYQWKKKGKEELLNYVCPSVNPEKAQVQQKRRHDYLELHNHCVSGNECTMNNICLE